MAYFSRLDFRLNRVPFSEMPAVQTFQKMGRKNRVYRETLSTRAFRGK
jgi:hypothetical protein